MSVAAVATSGSGAAPARFLVGFPVGALVGSAFDVAFISYEKRPSLSRPAPPPVSFLPAIDARRDRLVLGLGGAF